MRHDLDVASLVAGLTFVGIGLAFLVAEAGGGALQVRWVWPVLLIGLGLAGLAGSRPRGPHRRE